MADENIVINFVANTEGAVKQAVALRQEIEKAKEQIKQFADQTQTSYETAARAMKTAFKEQRLSQIKPEMALNPKEMRAALAQAKADIASYNASIKEALSQAKKEQKDEATAAGASATATTNAAKQKVAAIQSVGQAQKQAAQLAAQAAKIDKEQLKVAAEVAKVMKSQAQATQAEAKAQMAQAQAAFAYQNERSKAMLLRAKAYKAVQEADAAPAVQQQKVQQESARTAQMNAKAQNEQAKAITASSNAAVSGQIAQNKLTQSQNNAASSANRLTRSQLQLGGSVGKVAGMFGGLGKLAGFVFGGVLGITLISILQKLKQSFTDLVESGVSFSNSMYRLGASVRALQRSGLDITIAETVQQVEDLRKQFGFMSRREAVDGVTAIQLLTRNFDFSKEQMKQMTEAATVLSVVTGKDFGETARELALFLSSGYAESLQRAGLAVNRLTVTESAHRLGIEKGYTALTEQERALAGLKNVMDEIGPLTEEVANYQNSLAGRIETTNKKIQDQKDAIAIQLAPLKEAWVNFLSFLVGLYTRYTNFWSKLSLGFYAYFVAPLTTWIEILSDNFNKFLSGETIKAEDFYWIDKLDKKLMEAEKNWFKIPNEDEIKGMYEQAGKDAAGSYGMGLKDGLNDSIVDAIDEGTKSLLELIDKTNKDILDAQKELAKDMGQIDTGDLGGIMGAWNDFFSQNQNLTVDQVEKQQTIWENFFGEFGSITNDGLNKAWGIWRDYYAKLEDIARDTQNEIADAQRQLSQDLADLQRDTQQKLQDAARKYHDAEIKAERDYQEKLRRLREEYLFDLEDALRERDALQVIRLMRRYQLDKEQLAREKDNEAKDRADAYRQEIEDIRRQAERKAEELRIEYQRRLEEIQLQAERERENAAIARDQALQELKEDLERERAERQTKYEEELADLRKRFEDEVAEILKGLQDQYNVSDEQLKSIAKIFEDILGSKGVIAGSYSAFAQTMGNMTATIRNAVTEAISYLQQLQAAQAAAAASGTTTTQSGSLNDMQRANQMPPTYGHALGGTEYVNKPTWALFGEAGPEIAHFMPVNRLNTNSMSPIGAEGGIGGKMGQSGNIRVEVYLSPDLEGRIMDNTLGEAAKVFQDALSGGR